MKKIFITYSFILCSCFLYGQNRQNDVELLRHASQILHYNSVADNDIATLKQAAKIIPAITPVADMLVRKKVDRNLQKHTNAQNAIRKKVGKLTNKRGFEYVNILFNEAYDYTYRGDYEYAEKLYNEASSVLNQVPSSTNKYLWEYIIGFAKMYNAEFICKNEILLAGASGFLSGYFSAYSDNEIEKVDAIVQLCNYVVGATPQNPFVENSETYYNYTKGKNLIEKKYGTTQEMSLLFLYAYINSFNADSAEIQVNNAIKESEKLYGNENFVKLQGLYFLWGIQSYKQESPSVIVSTIEQCLSMLAKLFDENSPKALGMKRGFAQAFLYMGDVENIEKASKLMKEIVEQSKGNKFDEAFALYVKGNLYKQKKSFDNAIKSFDDAITILQDTPNSEDIYINVLTNKSEIYILRGMCDEAKEQLVNYALFLSENGMFDKAERLLVGTNPFLKNSGNLLCYADALSWLGHIYSKQEKGVEALDVITQSYQIFKNNNLEQTENFATLLTNYGVALVLNDNIEQAKEKFEEAIKRAKELNNQFLLGNCYSTYGYFWHQQKEYEKALDNYNIAKTYYQDCGDNAISEYLSVLDEMSNVYINRQEYAIAKNILTEIRNTCEQKFGKKHHFYLQSAKRLADLNNQIGNPYDIYNSIYDIGNALPAQIALANNDKHYRQTLLNNLLPYCVQVLIEGQNAMGDTYKNFLANPDKYKEYTEKYIAQFDKDAFDNMLKNLNNIYEFESILLEFKTELNNNKKESKHISHTLGDYYYFILQDYNNALKYYKESIETLDKNNIIYAEGLDAIGGTYAAMGNYNQAIFYQKQSLDIYKKLLDNENIGLSFVLYSLSFNYFKTKNYPQAFQTAKERFELLQHNINALFNIMNENDRLALSEKYMMNARDIYSVLPIYPVDEATQTAFDAALYYKGLLLRSSNRIRASILQSDNPILKDNYENLVQLRKELQSMPTLVETLTAGDTLAYLKTREIQRKIDSLDWYLTQKSTAYRQSHETPKWTDIHSKLKDGEVAIEFIISTDTIDNCNCKYGALLLKKNAKAPVYIPLFKEKQLVDIINECGNDINKLYLEKGKQLYELIWQPIEARLQNETTIYYSPVKKLYSIAFSALPLNGKQNYDFKMLSSTAELVNSNSNFEIDNADVYGEIMYGKGHWKEFSTKEASMINSLLQSNKVTSDLHTGTNATEETFRKNNGNSATWIHLDTHGEYEKVKENENDKLFSNRFGNAQSNPMNRAMLIMANANKAYENEDLKPYESDGVLLASEIADMNLDKTDLLVLSACKTGLGEESETEGIFGLQRAFKLAGVKTILMTLWSVDAEATTIFMTQFYSNLTKGMDKHDAFQNAVNHLKNYKFEIEDDDKSKEPILNNGFKVYPKMIIKKSYESPYYWAAYAMLDEI